MIDLDWRVHETDDVALVAAVVENEAPTPRRIVLDPRIDGPVLPPRRRGLPERGWTDEGFAGVVPAEGRLALGFASRGELEDPPVAVVDGGRASRDGATAAGADDPTPTAVLRNLGSPIPPRDAVPDGVTGWGSSLADRSGSSVVELSEASHEQSESSHERSGSSREQSASSREHCSPSSRDRRSEAPRGRGISTGSPGPGERDCPATRGLPDTVVDWLDDVATRVDRADRLVEGRTLEEAATAVEAAGGLAAVERLVDALGADQAALRAVADRATELADDCERREDVPVDAYRALS